MYTAASGALVAQSMADNTANNLANVSSSGFKQTLLQIQSAPSLDVHRIQTDPGQLSSSPLPGIPVAPLVGALGTGAQIYDTPEDFQQGPLDVTNNPLDLAITGGANAFFTIQTANGIRYTRDGQFSVSAQGQLVTEDGNLVLGTNNQPIQFQPLLGKPQVAANGVVSQGGQQVGQLQLTQFGNLVNVRKEGDNNFYDTGNAQPAAATTAGIQQGALEKSNFNVVTSMVNLITAERWFDANERSIKAEDDATNQAITNVGKTQ
jgi:flagellar basal-body rod protein FlgG